MSETVQSIPGIKKNTSTYKIIAAFSLLLMAILAPIALSWLKKLVGGLLIEEYSRNIYLIVIMFLFVALLDIVVALSFNKIFVEKQKILSNISMFLRILYAILLIVSLQPFLNKINSSDLVSTFNAFEKGWNIALLIFGFHLLILGTLIFRSNFISKILGILVIISGIGYLLDSILKFINPNTMFAISTFTFIGEALLIIWLPINVIRIKRILNKE